MLKSWFAAAINEKYSGRIVIGEEIAEVRLVGYMEALEKLAFQQDCDVLKRAFPILKDTKSWATSNPTPDGNTSVDGSKQYVIY